MKSDYFKRSKNIKRPSSVFFSRTDKYVRSHSHIRGGQIPRHIFQVIKQVMNFVLSVMGSH